MSIFDKMQEGIKSFFQPKNQEKTEQNNKRPDLQSMMGLIGRGYYGVSYAYNGEKDQGGIGPLINYYVDYDGLRSRSWKAYLDSELAQIILGKFKLWVIGKGLKLQCEPIKDVLKTLGVELTEEGFNDAVEARFHLYANSNIADYSGMKTLNQLAGTAFLDSKIGGDMLVILRYIDNQVKIQLIDGYHVQNPIGMNPFVVQLENGSIIKNGIEIDETGKHVAYYVRKRGVENNGTNDLYLNFESERIEAISKSSGLTMAFLVSGLGYRTDNVRSIPLLSAVMQTMTSMERYKEATVGSAEEAAKIFLAIEHNQLSDGENPLQDIIKHARGTSYLDKIPVDATGRQVADQVAVTTKKQVVNLQRGSSLKSFTGDKEIYFKDFYTVNIEILCATVNIPYAIAMGKYDTSYSSSRAAIKDWEHVINVNRHDFVAQFYSKVYAFWLDTEILKGNIKAPGYLEARKKGDIITLQAYRHARFVGAAVPHIDPVKEVEAQRLMLGDTGKSLPLTTLEAATEALNSGEADSNMDQYSKELLQSKSLKIQVDQPIQKQNAL